MDAPPDEPVLARVSVGDRSGSEAHEDDEEDVWLWRDGSARRADSSEIDLARASGMPVPVPVVDAVFCDGEVTLLVEAEAEGALIALAAFAASFS